ncbi:MAG: sorbosone dehydrogenase family protein [Beijerinckiaceae bacterium]|nr:sorbosone dehydrogenase family protein [Beijerinckiaceae bacterium]
MTNLSRAAAATFAATLALSLAGCGERSSVPENETYGADPALPPPTTSFIPTVNIAPAVGWPAGAQPQAAEGLSVTAFATGLTHPRTVFTLPNGDVLVAESDAPPKEESQGLRGWIMGFMMRRAGSNNPSANRISLLRDADGDGRAELKTPFLENLNSPFGMALLEGNLYVANTDAIVRFPYKEGDTRIDAAPTKVVDLPSRPFNHHWTKDLVASTDGTKLYVTVGSNSNVGEKGMAAEEGRAAVHEVDVATGRMRLFASGLRNPNAPQFEPQTNALWVVVNERDELGSDLVPDYMTSLKDGGFYGWPYSYYGQNVDTRITPARPDLVAKAIKPDYALGNHTAPLGLVFSRGELLPEGFRNGAFVGQHGSWNRRPRSGYKVIFVPFENGVPTGQPRDVLTGFVSADDKALGRPVGVTMDAKGALLVADDVGDTVWRVAPATPGKSATR